MRQWNGSFDPAVLDASLERLLAEEITAALAVGEDGTPRACTVYFAAAFPHVYFTSQETTQHVEILRDRPGASLAVWRRPAAWGGTLHGVQLFGTCSEVSSVAEAEVGLEALRTRFERVGDTLAGPADVFGDERKTCLLRFEVDGGTLVDEAGLGGRHFVEFRADGA